MAAFAPEDIGSDQFDLGIDAVGYAATRSQGQSAFEDILAGRVKAPKIILKPGVR